MQICLQITPKLKSQVMILMSSLNQDLENVSTWMSASKLTLIRAKTEYMIVGSNRSVKHIDLERRLHIKVREVNTVKITKSLGIIIPK